MGIVGLLIAIGQSDGGSSTPPSSASLAPAAPADSARIAADDRQQVERVVSAGAAATDSDVLATDATIHARSLTTEHQALHTRAVGLRLDEAAAALVEGTAPQTALAYKALEEARAPLTKPQAARVAAMRADLDGRSAKLAKQLEVSARREYAHRYETRLLDKGMDATVTTSGPDATALQLKYIFVGRVLVHQVQKGDLLDELRQLGFKRFTMTDGYDDTWTWKL